MSLRRLAAVFGFLAVALGAFGAHVLRERLTPEGETWWATATLYHLVHSAVLLASGRPDGTGRPSAASWCFAGGVVFFSGSLYAMALADARWLAALTPIGGVGLLLGWALLALRR